MEDRFIKILPGLLSLLVLLMTYVQIVVLGAILEVSLVGVWAILMSPLSLAAGVTGLAINWRSKGIGLLLAVIGTVISLGLIYIYYL